MNYKKAESVLPEELILQIQNYIDGEYLYIPRKANERKAWGAQTDTREELRSRNNNIYQDYMDGKKTTWLAEKYYLSEKSIWRIIHRMKTMN